MRKEVNVGDVYKSNSFGDVEVVTVFDSNKVRVRFLDTGTIATTTRTKLFSGRMKDKNKRTILGVGYIGYGSHRSSKNGVESKAYQCWHGMIARCYCKKFLKKRPSYEGCTVCEEWHNFQNFADWYYENYPKDGVSYELDKDIKLKGNRIYSPETCIFATRKENTTQARAKRYRLLSPSGDIVEVYNLKEFCIENNISNKNLCSARNKSKGWSIIERL